MGEPWEAPTVLDRYIEHLKLEVDAATARAEATDARVRRLEEALAPFAKMMDALEAVDAEKPGSDLLKDAEKIIFCTWAREAPKAGRLTIGHLRRARAALAKEEGGE